MNAYYCVLIISRVRVRITFNVWLVSGYAHVFTLGIRSVVSRYFLAQQCSC